MPLFENGRYFQFHNATFTDVSRDINVYYGNRQTALSMLESQVTASAFHNSNARFDPPKCHPKTRFAVLEQIRGWYKSKETATPRLMRLDGPAGAMKSAIAQTMAEECHMLRTLAASFFFSRTAPGRDDATRLVATIAYQIAHEIPETQIHIQQALEGDPMIFLKSLETQLHQLATKPLLDILSHYNPSSQSWPKLSIIDGLDECGDGKIQQDIIRCFSSALLQQVLPLRILILSRPEQADRGSFSHPDLHWIYPPPVLDNDYQSDRDIGSFLRESFNEMRRTHALQFSIPHTWPSDDDISALVRKLSGQFIFASTVMRYAKSPHHRPLDRLNRQHLIEKLRILKKFFRYGELNPELPRIPVMKGGNVSRYTIPDNAFISTMIIRYLP